MNVQRVLNNGIKILTDATQGAVQKTPSISSDVISNASNKGLDALANYNSGLLKKNIDVEILIAKVKEKLFSNDFITKLSDDEIKFIASNFVDTKAKYLDREIVHKTIAFNKFSELDKLTREKFMNSDAIKILMNSSPKDSFKFSCFNIAPNEIDKLDELLKDDLIKHYFENYFKKESKNFQAGADDLLPAFNKAATNLKYGFCSIKEAPMFYDLLKKRDFEDIEELTNIIFANARFLDEKELDEFHSVLKKLLDAKTPNGDFVFGVSEASDKTSKQMLSGIENILNARKNNPQEYEQYLKLLDLTQDGTIPPSILGTLAKEGKISQDFIKAIEKKLSGFDGIVKFDNLNIAKEQANLGDAIQVGEKLFYKNQDELIELNLSPEIFKQLFPEIETKALEQGKLGDCYLISAIYDFMKNPNAKGKIYQMFEESGDDIIVKIPDAPEFPIKFPKKALKNNGEKKVNASLGVQMLEDAYSQTRALKYGVENSITTIEGGNQSDVYNALLGKNNSEFWTTINSSKRTMQEIDEEIEEITKEIEKLKSTIKGLEDSKTLIGHSNYLVDQDKINRLHKLEAYQRMLHEDKLNQINIHTVKDDELLEKLLNTSLDDNLISIGTKKSDILDKDKLIYGNHAYSVLNIDKANQAIDIVNPWNTAQYTTISFQQFKYYFDALNIAKIQ